MRLEIDPNLRFLKKIPGRGDANGNGTLHRKHR